MKNSKILLVVFMILVVIVFTITIVIYKTMPFYKSSYGDEVSFSLTDTASYEILYENDYFEQRSIDNNLVDYDSYCDNEGSIDSNFVHSLYFEKKLKNPTLDVQCES